MSSGFEERLRLAWRAARRPAYAEAAFLAASAGLCLALTAVFAWR